MKDHNVFSSEAIEYAEFVLGVLATIDTPEAMKDDDAPEMNCCSLGRRQHSHAEKRRAEIQHKISTKRNNAYVKDFFSQPVYNLPKNWEKIGAYRHARRQWNAGRTSYHGKCAMSAKERRRIDAANSSIDDMSLQDIADIIPPCGQELCNSWEDWENDEIETLRLELSAELDSLSADLNDIYRKIATVSARLSELQ